MVSATEASVVGSEPPDDSVTVGAVRNRPGSVTTGALKAPGALEVNDNQPGRGLKLVISTAGLATAETLVVPPPPVVTPPPGMAASPQPPPPATTDALAMVCMTNGVIVAPVPAPPAAVSVSAEIVDSDAPL